MLAFIIIIIIIANNSDSDRIMISQASWRVMVVATNNGGTGLLD
jgi:hypothetical protein